MCKVCELQFRALQHQVIKLSVEDRFRQEYSEAHDLVKMPLVALSSIFNSKMNFLWKRQTNFDKRNLPYFTIKVIYATRLDLNEAAHAHIARAYRLDIVTIREAATTRLRWVLIASRSTRFEYLPYLDFSLKN